MGRGRGLDEAHRMICAKCDYDFPSSSFLPGKNICEYCRKDYGKFKAPYAQREHKSVYEMDLISSDDLKKLRKGESF